MNECENYIPPMTCLNVSVPRYPICSACEARFAEDLHEGTTADLPVVA